MGLPCIFLVDDDFAILESFEYILEHEGYRIFTATSGSELKTLLSKHVPNLILIDYSLGEENGGELTEDIKKNPPTSNVPVIVISASARSRTHAIVMGADDFIEKPIEIPHLLSKIEEHLTRGECIRTPSQT